MGLSTRCSTLRFSATDNNAPVTSRLSGDTCFGALTAFRAGPRTILGLANSARSSNRVSARSSRRCQAESARVSSSTEERAWAVSARSERRGEEEAAARDEGAEEEGMVEASRVAGRSGLNRSDRRAADEDVDARI